MTLTKIRTNMLIDLVSRVWGVALSICAIPFYLKFIGVESYGLIGAFNSIQIVLSLLDLGMGPALMREMALAGDERKSMRIRDLIRTLEIVYWCMAIAAAVLLFTAAPVIVHSWLNANRIGDDAAILALRVGAFIIALQWPGTLYSGGLVGQHRIAELATLSIVLSSLRVLGTLLALWRIDASVETFFAVQAIAGLAQTVILRTLLWRGLPTSPRAAHFDPALLREIARFASGMSGIAVTAVILTQADKLILTRLLPLEEFGFYVLASTLASGLYVLISPIFSSMMPRFSQSVGAGRESELSNLYHSASQLMAVAILPAAAILILFPREVLFIWTGNLAAVDRSAAALSLLTIGNLMNGLMHMAYAVELAYGWTRPAIIFNVVSIAALAPLMWAMVAIYGAPGAAAAWVALNFIMIFVRPHVLHSRYLRNDKNRWYRDDFAMPVLAAVVMAGVLRLIAVPLVNRVGVFAILGICWLLIQTVTVLATPQARERLFEFLRRRQLLPN